jgi:hypothetical protein
VRCPVNFFKKVITPAILAFPPFAKNNPENLRVPEIASHKAARLLA